MLSAGTGCCTRTYTLYPVTRTSQRVNYTTVLKYMKCHAYPKSTIDIQSQAALRALKSLEDCPFLHQLPPNFIQVNQLDFPEGPLFLQTVYTTPSANTKSQLHR